MRLSAPCLSRSSIRAANNASASTVRGPNRSNGFPDVQREGTPDEREFGTCACAIGARHEQLQTIKTHKKPKQRGMLSNQFQLQVLGPACTIYPVYPPAALLSLDSAFPPL